MGSVLCFYHLINDYISMLTSEFAHLAKVSACNESILYKYGVQNPLYKLFVYDIAIGSNVRGYKIIRAGTSVAILCV